MNKSKKKMKRESSQQTEEPKEYEPPKVEKLPTIARTHRYDVGRKTEEE
jgi:hypothetical protein